ncbi:hypothetical protein N7539_008238 [Penicillium diatomitis]|uniref:Glycoprotease family protein n=1 Tax=Penicillium diatomitis TaxID=2819901 RepID=A0A9W9WTE2_9EURO|nr:uncharacterized protein N7539_008238 [Penicillium diatomitis]KAJ5475172.1 hypothetical protein N7539_008238 [Penicillium diatomitis]
MPLRKDAPQLQVPTLPVFPLSSPISEEISSPSCSSADDKELERTRPFDFMVKATKQRAETKVRQDGNSHRTSPKLSHRARSDSGSKRHSIRGITKSKKHAAAKPVGLNLVTDFSLAAPPQPKKYKMVDECAPFVDLNDLKALSDHRARQRFDQSTESETMSRSRDGFLGAFSNMSKKPDSYRQISDETQRLENERTKNRNPFLNPDSEDALGDRIDSGLSPSDRHVLIGLSVPRNEAFQYTKDLDSAGAPMTPTIIVTPAREDAPWTSSSPEYLRPRATSSIYSQPTPRLWQNGPDVPPVPAIPTEHTKELTQTGTSARILNAHLVAMTRPRRSMSVETVIEDDLFHGESSLIYSDSDDGASFNRFRVNTQSLRPESQGWWTYLLSPLLGKKSPLSPSFPRSKGQGQGPESKAPSPQEIRQACEKEISCFSPETPESALPTQWQESENTPPEKTRSVENDSNTEKDAYSLRRQTTASMMFAGRSIQGEAAEYYQACAHELFSKTPYFECFNHVCSITPEHIVAARYAAQFDADEGETRDRGLILAEAGIHEKEQDKSQLLDGNRGLLIDVDSPTIEEKDGKGSNKLGSPSSAASSDSWASSLSDDDSDVVEREKSVSSTPQNKAPEATRDPFDERKAETPPQIAEPVPESSPAAATATLEPPKATPPAPAVMPEPPVPIPAPAPQFTNTISPPANTIHIEQQPAPTAPPPIIIERNNPYYGAFYPPVSQPAQPDPVPQEQSRSVEHDLPAASAEQDRPTKEEEARGTPGILTKPRPVNPGKQEIDHVPIPAACLNEPISPAFQRAAGGPGSIPMSSMNMNNDVSAPAPTYSQHPRDDALPQYMLHPAPGAAIMNPTGERGPAEVRRQRHEREDAIGRKIGGFWRGRGCFSKKGCFGRSGREGRTRRRWYFAICIFFLAIVIVAIVLATTLTRKGDTTPVQSQWLNLTGYPPMPTGISTVAGAEPRVEQPGCIKPSSLWSCALPKGQQRDNKPYAADEPNFRMEIRFRNGTYPNSTTIASSSERAIRRRDVDSWTSSPAPPSTTDQIFLGNTTDGVSIPYDGEITPFYITFLSSVQVTPNSLFRRSSSSSSNDTSLFPNLTTAFPAPAVNSDGTAAAAILYPLPESQPIRLYNRGQDTEHYGFYTYFDKSIFLASRAPLNGSADDLSPLDQNGGSTESDAAVRCTWSQTRFLVQIWTRSSKLGYTLLSPSSNSTAPTTTSTATTPSSTSPHSSSSPSSSATNFTRPGSFPYPLTITIDRHGGAQRQKLVYCYSVESDQHYNITDRKLQIEDRGFAGTLVNPASGIFDNVPGAGAGAGAQGLGTHGFGGIDGGSGGCACQWTNWIVRS